MIEEKNAIIRKATISNEDHGCLTAYLHLEYGGSGQGFGGFNLGRANPKELARTANYAGHFIARCMDVAGVSEWSQLPGKTIRVRSEHTKVHAIGHIVHDNWFCPSDDFKD